jgi:phosphoglucosamine mutase
MRKKLFGTDGIRGLVNCFPIDSVSLVKLAYAIASYFYQGQKLKCIIGKDTRVSGYMIESALVSGLLAKNVDVVFLGPIPSPGVAMLTPAVKADFGIMISASHNPS